MAVCFSQSAAGVGLGGSVPVGLIVVIGSGGAHEGGVGGLRDKAVCATQKDGVYGATQKNPVIYLHQNIATVYHFLQRSR